MKTKTLILLLLCILLGSCAKEPALSEKPLFELGGERWERTELDKLIFNEFTKPYNIEIKYKWNPYEVNHNRTLVPPIENRVYPVLTAIQEGWMKPYEKVGGPEFLRRFPLTKFALVGSPQFESDGSSVLGRAEGGTKIVLFNVNDFLIDNIGSLEGMFRTIHHEYAHILHQNIHYPEAWRGISTEHYTPTWYNSNTETANSQGLVTPYAKASEAEDFVETIAYLLIEGQDSYDWITEYYEEAAPIFRLKESLIVKYFKDAFNIDFRELQREVQDAIWRLAYN